MGVKKILGREGQLNAELTSKERGILEELRIGRTSQTPRGESGQVERRFGKRLAADRKPAIDRREATRQVDGERG